MKPCWRHAGLSEAEAAIAEELLPKVMRLCRAHGVTNIHAFHAAVDEALWRVVELPKRTPEFQREYRRLNSTKGAKK